MIHKLTPKQLEIKARKFRLIAGTLHVECRNQKLPPDLRMSIAHAHDSLWNAIRELESLAAETAQ